MNNKKKYSLIHIQLCIHLWFTCRSTFTSSLTFWIELKTKTNQQIIAETYMLIPIMIIWRITSRLAERRSRAASLRLHLIYNLIIEQQMRRYKNWNTKTLYINEGIYVDGQRNMQISNTLQFRVRIWLRTTYFMLSNFSFSGWQRTPLKPKIMKCVINTHMQMYWGSLRNLKLAK